jgi:VanZ family protein
MMASFDDIEDDAWKGKKLTGVEGIFVDGLLANDSCSGYSIEMFWKLAAAAAWGCFVFIIYATLSSLSNRPELTSSETDLIVALERFGAYALLGNLFMVTYPGRVKFVCLLVLGSAVLLELLQIFVPDRDARILDALEKLAGGIVGISFAYGIRNSSGLRR